MLAPNRLASLVAPVLLATLQLHCSSDSSFQCSSSNAEDCGNAGFCEPTGFCSFEDAGCPSGRRYGDLAESLSNQCVPLETGTESTTESAGTLPTGTETTTSTTGIEPSGGGASSTGAELTTMSGASTDASADGTTAGDTDATTSDETTTGEIGMCQLETFDELPGKPNWFNFGGVDVADGELLLDVDPPAEANAGFRTALPLDLTGGSFTVVLTELPELAVATASVNIVDEIFKNEASLGFGVIDGVLRAERGDGMSTITLQSEAIPEGAFPVTLRIEVTAEAVVMTASSEGETPFLAWDEELPDWLDDVYVSISAGNPVGDPTLGVLSFDSLELCPGF